MVATKTVNVTEFKAKCLSLFDEVEAGNLSITVTRRGKPIGVVSAPPKTKKIKSSSGMWKGKMEIVGDIVNVDYSELWDHLNGRHWDHSATAQPAAKKARSATK